MNKLILILGGARSGKSTFSVTYAKKQCRLVAYIATAPCCDKEMEQRIKLHKRSRPRSWITIEPQGSIIRCIEKIPKTCDGLMIECIATYVSNLMMAGFSDTKIIKDMKEVLRKIKKLNRKVFIVSNEVGGGVVPETAEGRRFRDIVGTLNQIITKKSDEVYLTVAGLPLKLK